MFKEFDQKKAVARAVTGFVAGAVGTYLNRVLVRIAEVWQVFHFRSIGPLETLLSQDWPLITKASLIFGVIYGTFCLCVPSHLVPATALLMAILVLVGRAYMIDGFQFGAVYDDSIWIIMHASVRAALLLLVYWLLRALIVRRLAGPY